MQMSCCNFEFFKVTKYGKIKSFSISAEDLVRPIYLRNFFLAEYYFLIFKELSSSVLRNTLFSSRCSSPYKLLSASFRYLQVVWNKVKATDINV